MSLRDAFQHTMLKSKFAIGTDPDSEDYYTNIESDIRDKARLGQLTVWARPLQAMTGGSRKTLAPVSPEKWDQYRISLPSCIYDSELSALIIDHTNPTWLKHEDAQVNRQQVLSLWPRSSWWERIRDPANVRRLQWFEQERQGPVNPEPLPEEDSDEITGAVHSDQP